MRASPALFKKPWIAASGAPTRGPLRSSMLVGLFGGQADDMQREPARRRKALRALIEQAALDQRVGDQALQVLGALALHARGDFFAEQFEQEIGHVLVLSSALAFRRPPSSAMRRRRLWRVRARAEYSSGAR